MHEASEIDGYIKFWLHPDSPPRPTASNVALIGSHPCPPHPLSVLALPAINRPLVYQLIAMVFFPVLFILMALTTCCNMSMTTDTRQLENSMVLATLPPDLTEVDFIVVGGGTAGSIIAARLSDADPKASILVIEAGPESFDLPTVVYPALYRQNISPTSTTLKFHFAAPEAQLANRSIPILTGNTLGGGSAVNLLMYARGQQADFNDWKAKGWSAEELLPFLKKVNLSRSEP